MKESIWAWPRKHVCHLYNKFNLWIWIQAECSYCHWARHTVTTALLMVRITLHWLCFPHALPLLFRNPKRSLPSSMKPGKRNCERRRQSAWRGQYWQTMSVLFHLYLPMGEMCVPRRLQFVCVLSVLDNPPIARSLSFHPSVLSVSLSSPICLVSSALILSISLPFSVVTLCCANTPLSPVLPLLSTHLWLQTSTMLPSVHWVSLVPFSACCHTTNHFL